MLPGKTCTEVILEIWRQVMGERSTRVVSSPRMEGVVGLRRRVSAAGGQGMGMLGGVCGSRRGREWSEE